MAGGDRQQGGSYQQASDMGEASGMGRGGRQRTMSQDVCLPIACSLAAVEERKNLRPPPIRFYTCKIQKFSWIC